LNFVYRRGDFAEALTVNLFRFGAHPGDGQDLTVLDGTLL
jgi:hypothetical protein